MDLLGETVVMVLVPMAELVSFQEAATVVVQTVVLLEQQMVNVVVQVHFQNSRTRNLRSLRMMMNFLLQLLALLPQVVVRCPMTYQALLLLRMMREWQLVDLLVVVRRAPCG